MTLPTPPTSPVAPATALDAATGPRTPGEGLGDCLVCRRARQFRRKVCRSCYRKFTDPRGDTDGQPLPLPADATDGRVPHAHAANRRRRYRALVARLGDWLTLWDPEALAALREALAGREGEL